MHTCDGGGGGYSLQYKHNTAIISVQDLKFDYHMNNTVNKRFLDKKEEVYIKSFTVFNISSAHITITSVLVVVVVADSVLVILKTQRTSY